MTRPGICCSPSWPSSSRCSASTCWATDCAVPSMCGSPACSVSEAMDMLIARDLVISATLGDGDGVVSVIQQLNFSLPAGRILGIVGESGAGKSMIGRAISQLLPAGFSVAGGELIFDGQDLISMAPDARRELLGRDIAFVPQE